MQRLVHRGRARIMIQDEYFNLATSTLNYTLALRIAWKLLQASLKYLLSI